ncbi:SRPBCC domain-containing protein [Candidatus Leptofilum sp.]|uniref:SRPBCC domain-containing protein n=1 Tax=Candidatus Leptofilum sp. TaxID=3241576 RepID=UPI003B5A8090
MEFRGNVTFAATQTAVWQTLTTPELVGQCTPRLQGWSPLETNTQFQLQFCWGSGKSTVIIPVLLIWQTVTPPTYLQWTGEAQMGSTAVPIQGDFSLQSTPASQTTLTFTAQLNPPNKLLAQMIQTTAPRLIESFFHCLKTTTEAV